MSKYRIVYGGSGQCSRTFSTFAEARRELAQAVARCDDYVASYRIQRHDGEEWIGLGAAGKPEMNPGGRS